MKPIIAIIALLAGSTLIGSTPARANDSAISGTSGTPGNLKATQLAGEHKTIRMVRERVVMTLRLDDYISEANFVFHNDGPATTVKMGFPEGAGGDTNFEKLKKKTSFKEFETWVDGREIKATRMVADANEDDFTLDAFWVKTVPFQRGQTREVRVRYRSPLGSSTDGDFVFYDFTGGNWKGKVDESTLRVNFTVPGYYRLFPLDEQLAKYSRTDGANFIQLRWRTWEAQTGFTLRYLRTLPNGLTRAYEPKDVDEVWDVYSGMKTLVVRGGKDFDVWKSDANWPPAALLRDGRAFIQFRRLSEAMREAWSNRHGGWNGSDKAGLYVSGDLAIAPYYGKGNQILAVEIGKKTAAVGPRTISLPAAPFRAGGVLYVPFAAIVEAMNGTAKVNTKTMRFYLDVPI